MLTVVALVVFGARLIVHLDEHALHGIIEIFLAYQTIAAEHYFVLSRDESALKEVIAQHQLDGVLLEDLVICDQRVAHGGPELVACDEFPEVATRLKLRVPIVPLDHFLPLYVKAGIQGDISGEEGLLELIVLLLEGLRRLGFG